MRRAHLCGDCSVEAVLAGGEDLDGQTIAYGTGCENHPELLAATHVVMVPDDFTRTRTEAPVPAQAPLETPIAVGPLTDLASRLLSAWSRGDMTKADPNAITYAVKAARLLLNETGGR